jgi:hypothetical protein
MAETKARSLASIIDNTGDIKSTSLDNASTGLTVYATLDDLPTTGLTSGQQAFVTSANRIYVSNGSGWYNVALFNATPRWLIEPNASYDIADSATSLVITAKAADSDNADANLLHQSIVADSAQYLVDISRDSSVYTFAPKSQDSIGTAILAGNLPVGADSSLANDFIYTFKWSDGINFISKAVTINYSLNPFNTLDPFSDGSLLALYALDGDGTDETGNYDATGFREGSSSGYQTSIKQVGTGSLQSTNTVLDLPDVRTSFPITVSAWIRPDDWTDTGANCIFNMTVSGARLTLTLTRWSNYFAQMKPMVAFGGSSHIHYHNFSGITFTNQQWYHITATVTSQNNAAVYVNGVPNSSVQNHGGTAGGTAGWALGGNMDGNERFKGYVDHARVFNKVLSASEALSLYENGG